MNTATRTATVMVDILRITKQKNWNSGREKHNNNINIFGGR
jgi:hypothetical protein